MAAKFDALKTEGPEGIGAPDPCSDPDIVAGSNAEPSQP